MIKILTVSNVSFASSLNEKQRTCGRVASRTNMRLLAALNDRSNFSLFWALKKKFLSSDSVLLISVLCLHPLALMLVMIVKCKLMLSV